MNQEANDLAAKVFRTLIVRHTEIGTFRNWVKLGLRHATPQIVRENLRSARQFFEDPAHDEFFLDKPAILDAIGGVAGFAEKTTSSGIETVIRSVDAASLVFMHSALDGAAQDLCRATALVASSDWEQFIKDQKVGLMEVKSTAYEVIFKQRLGQHLKALERESLLKKIDRLFQVCQPPDGFSFVQGYSFDRERVERLDKDRHAIIHGDGVKLEGLEESLQFLVDTGLHLFGLVNQRYGFKIDPVAFMNQWGK